MLTENGDLACLQAADGKTLWQPQHPAGLQGRESQVAHQRVAFGGRRSADRDARAATQASLVALDKSTGETIWTSKELSDRAGYSSGVVAEVQGIRTLLAFTAAAAVGLRADDGQLLWRYEPVANRTANVTTPVLYQDKAFYSSAYGTGCALLELKADNGSMEAKEVYFKPRNDEPPRRSGAGRRLPLRVLQRHPHLHGVRDGEGDVEGPQRGQGIADLCRRPALPCSAKRTWWAWPEATTEAYRETGRFEVADQGWPSWAHPVVSGGRLYIRNQGVLNSYDIRAAKNGGAPPSWSTEERLFEGTELDPQTGTRNTTNRNAAVSMN